MPTAVTAEPNPARPRTTLSSLVSTDDYSAAALRARKQETVAFKLNVDPSGRVSDRAITAESASVTLDAAACRFLRASSRFTPATDAKGRPTTDTVADTLSWILPTGR